MSIRTLITALILAVMISVSTLLYVDYVKPEQEADILSLIIEYCNDTSGVKNAIAYGYSNDTHFINNEVCEWQRLPLYPNSTVICNPYADKGVTGKEIRNKTHIFDKHSCSWDADPDYDPLNSQGCPQFCPKEKSSSRYEKYLDENNELNFGLRYSKYGIAIDALQRILDWCDYPGEKPAGWYFDWNNSTHHIDSDDCEWTENEN